DLKDFHAPLLRRPADGDVPIESPRAEERGIEDVRPVRGADHNHEVILREAIHLAEDLIERLLALVMAATKPRPTLPADGVDLVDEDDRGRVVFGDFEQIADTASADADEHLDEFAAIDRVKGNARFSGDGAGEQRFAGTRRAIEQHPLRNAAAELLKLGGVL